MRPNGRHTRFYIRSNRAFTATPRARRCTDGSVCRKNCAVRIYGHLDLLHHVRSRQYVPSSFLSPDSLANSTSVHPNTVPITAALSHFTPPPVRIVQSRSPQDRPYFPCPTRTRRPNITPPDTTEPSTPTSSQLTEDFLSLRDPFASPNIGIVGVGLGLGAGVSPITEPSFYQPRSKSRSKLKLKPSATSHDIRRSRKRACTPTPTSPTTPALRTLGSMSTLAPAEDVDIDPEEAFLTQLLLRNLDAHAHAPVPAMRTAARAPAAHRFTQDSTSTGRTLCESEVFKLPRGSVSTEVGSACVSACVSACAGASASQPASPVSV